MTTLNVGARDAAEEARVHAATDVTGFGLLGHLRGVCAASGTGAVVDAAAVPVIPGVRDLLADGMVAGGTRRNLAFVAPDVDFGDLPDAERLLLADAQTSGGLLLSVAPDRAQQLLDACRSHGTPIAAMIGEMTESDAGRITIRR
jgi:selenide,water dikinase